MALFALGALLLSRVDVERGSLLAREAEAQARRAAEEERRREAAENARREAEARAQRESEERAQREQAELVRRELEERARQTEAAARREAAERRREAEERSGREAEERARHEAEAQALRAATEQAEQEAAGIAARHRDEDEAARRESAQELREEEKARAKAEAEAAARARREERAREKAELGARAEAKRKAQKKERSVIAARLERIRSGKQRRIGRYFGIALGALIVAGLVYVHLMPLDIAQYEQLATTALGTPVKIGSGNLSLFPAPAIRFENVRLGKDGNVRIGVASASPEYFSLLGDRPQLKTIELQDVALDMGGLTGALFGRPQGTLFGLEQVHATGVKLAVPGMSLPELEATATFQIDGTVQRIAASSAGKTIVAEAAPLAGGRAEVEVTIGDPSKLLGLPFAMESLSTKGVVTATEFTASELDGRLLDGLVRAKGTLRWGSPLVFDASFELKQVDAKRIAPVLAGRVEGAGVVAAQGSALDKLTDGVRVDGSFSVQKGQLAGVDLARTLQAGKSVAGTTNFNELSGQARLDKGRLSLRGVKLDAGAFSANGTVDVDDEKSLAGKLAADMKIPGGALRATLIVSGTPAQLSVKR